jgi:hypothetical protein
MRGMLYCIPHVITIIGYRAVLLGKYHLQRASDAEKKISMAMVRCSLYPAIDISLGITKGIFQTTGSNFPMILSTLKNTLFHLRAQSAFDHFNATAHHVVQGHTVLQEFCSLHF